MTRKTYAIAACSALLFLAGCASTVTHKDELIERGWIDRADLRSPGLGPFQAGIDSATIDPNFTEFVRKAYDGEQVIIFLGTWCSDSRKHVPRFLRLMDLAGISQDAVRLYGLDRTKRSDDGLSEKYAVSRVPTFVVLKEGKEVGRIVETPQVSVEDDILQILIKAR